MKKITAKFITDNLNTMFYGTHILFKGAEYWVAPNLLYLEDEDRYIYDTKNGTIYKICASEKILGSILGDEYGKVINGVPYKY